MMRTKTIRIILVTFPFLIIAACTGSKKTTTSSSTAQSTSTATKTEIAKTEASPTVAATAPAPPAALAGAALPPNALIGSKPGVIPPTETELNALVFKYPNLKDATLEKLKKGHVIYTQGACVNCHRPVNIYNIPEVSWPSILGDMCLRARLTDAEKDAVVNYVIAIKTAQPK